MRTWRKGSTRAALLTASFVALGAGVAQADVTSPLSEVLSKSPVNVNAPDSSALPATDLPVVGDVQDKASKVQGTLPGGGELSASQLQALVQKLRTQTESLQASLPVNLPAGAAQSKLQTQIQTLQDKAEDLESQLSAGAPTSKLRNQVRNLRDQVQNLRDKAQTFDGNLPAKLPGPASDLQDQLPDLADRLNNGGSTNFGANNEIGLPDATVDIRCTAAGVAGDARADCPGGPGGDDGGSFGIQTDDINTGDGLGGGGGGTGGMFSNNQVNAPNLYLGVHCTSVGAVFGNAAANCVGAPSGGNDDGYGARTMMVHSAASDPGGGMFNNNTVNLGGVSAGTHCLSVGAVFGNASSNCGSGEIPRDDGPGIELPIGCTAIGAAGDASAECDDGDNGGDDGDGDNGGDDGDGDNGGDGDDDAPGNGGGDDNGGDDSGAPVTGGEQLPVTGLNLGSLLALAFGALAAGAACVVAAVRRPRVNRG